MASLKCSMCGSTDLKELGSNVATPMDRAGMAWARLHPAASVAALALQGAKLVYNLACTNVYHCNDCSHQFRK